MPRSRSNRARATLRMLLGILFLFACNHQAAGKKTAPRDQDKIKEEPDEADSGTDPPKKGNATKDDDEEPDFGAHIMLVGVWRATGRDKQYWDLGGGGKFVLGRQNASTLVGALVGLRALAFKEDGVTERVRGAWFHPEALLAYDLALSAEGTWPRKKKGKGHEKLPPPPVQLLVGGHAGAALIPAVRVRYTCRDGQVTAPTKEACGRLDRDNFVALSLGLRMGMAVQASAHGQLTLQVGLDARTPVRAHVDLEPQFLVGMKFR